MFAIACGERQEQCRHRIGASKRPKSLKSEDQHLHGRRAVQLVVTGRFAIPKPSQSHSERARGDGAVNKFFRVAQDNGLRNFLRACLKIAFGVAPLGGTGWEPPKGRTPNVGL